jgi:Protein of unknown function (DUF3667)
VPTTTLDSLETGLAADAAAATASDGGPGGQHEQCLNCETVLQGPYCHRCGQHDEEIKRPLWSLAEHALDSVFHFDSRILRSYGWLLARPGRMTAAFLAGQRARFVPPIRLYIFTSLIFFLALSASGFVLIQPVSFRTTEGDHTTNTIAFELLSPPAAEPVLLPANIAAAEDGAPDMLLDVTRHGQRRTISVAQAIDYVNHPVRLSQLITEWLPKVLIAAMPFFVLLLGLLYVRRGRFLIDHVVLTLHLHAFLFAVGILLIALRAATGLGVPGPVLFFALLAYFVLTIKRVYAQDWARTLLKSFVLLLAYPCILALAIMALAVWA